MDSTENLSPAILRNIRLARPGHTPRPADRAALAGLYVLPPHLQGVAVWREHGLINDVTVNGRRYHVLSAKAMQIRTELTAA